MAVFIKTILCSFVLFVSLCLWSFDVRFGCPRSIPWWAVSVASLFCLWVTWEFLPLQKKWRETMVEYQGLLYSRIGVCWKWAKDWVAQLATHWLFGRVVPSVTAIYYLVLDVWGDHWKIIAENKGLHGNLFIVCVGLNVVGLFLTTFQEARVDATGDAGGRQALSDFISSVGAIVAAKITRFRTRIETFSAQGKKSGKFELITHPEDQLGIIADAAAKFLCPLYGLRGDDINITVLAKKSTSQDWKYIFTHQQWHQTPPGDLMVESSSARKSDDDGETRLIPNKLEASRRGEYYLTKRDIDRGKKGSCFTHPVSVATPSGHDRYIISIVSYRKQFCDEWDTPSKKATETFLKEFSRRIELELCLKTLKGLA